MAFRLGINFETNVAALINDMSRASRSVSQSSQQMSSSLKSATGLAKGLVAAFGVGFSVRGIVGAADQFSNLSSKIRVVSVDAAAAQKAFNSIRTVAAETNTSIGATTELYSRLTVATKEMGLSQAQVTDMTKAFNQTMRLSGVSASEAAASTLQFGQAMASGRLQGDELRSLLENNNRFSRLMAEGLGVSVGALKDLGKEGYLTSEVVGKILLRSLEQLNAEAANIAPTIGGAMKEIGDQFSASFFNKVNANIGSVTRELDVLSATASDLGEKFGDMTLALIDWSGRAAYAVKQAVGYSKNLRATQDLVASMHGPSATLNVSEFSGKGMGGLVSEAKEFEKVFANVRAGAVEDKESGGFSLSGPLLPAGALEKLKGGKKGTDDLSDSFGKLQDHVADVRKENARMFNDLSSQIMSAGNDMESLRSIGLSVLSDFASGIADLMFGGDGGNSTGGNLAASFMSLFGGGAFVASSGTAAFSKRSQAELTGAALSGAFGPGFANGGIANKPSIFGEAGPEAAVPLPDGRRIPVDLRGGGGGPMVYADCRGADEAAVARLEATIKDLNGTIERRAIAAVADKFSRSRGFMRT